MKLPTKRTKLLALLPMVLFLTSCVEPVVVERPKDVASQAEKSVCNSLAEYFPTWAYDELPETVANRIDTKVSVEEGVKFTGVFRAVCPGAL